VNEGKYRVLLNICCKAFYGDFMQLDGKIAIHILAHWLVVLEAQGLASKQVAANKKSKFTYRLAEKGIDL
jgi:DNA-binding HxlR family transcriptional regulator